ncbi:hypothetical protein Poli38472_005975 [Pythium oligandrum]|uniref:Phospholipase B-like n=1 Tax=Pythium oligandrum TaxID=41045 RepID=A0A8K1FR13_PYTOL|nr:hypothetical protein Poli38472_005975 [Pythium oligandrum]|eukprot:TMW68507.1 hypothetical protein Poli38472_005975 [Pythium oligandrum]
MMLLAEDVSESERYGTIAITRSAKKEAHWNSDVESEFVTPPTESTTTHSVYIYRGHNRNVGISYGMERPKKEADAWAEFNDGLPAIGWSQLRVKTAELKPHEYENHTLAHRRRKEIMFAAGFAEGLLIHRPIDEHFFNLYHTFFTSKNATENQTVAALHEFFEKNLLWIEEQIKVHENATETSPEIDYWETVGSILAQFDGLYAGYRRATQTTRPISALDLYVLKEVKGGYWSSGLEDLIPVVQHGLEKPEVSSDPTTPFVNFVKSLKCSALVRILPNASDLAWGHATWDSYSSMNRIFKHYEVPYI